MYISYIGHTQQRISLVFSIKKLFEVEVVRILCGNQTTSQLDPTHK